MVNVEWFILFDVLNIVTGVEVRIYHSKDMIYKQLQSDDSHLLELNKTINRFIFLGTKAV